MKSLVIHTTSELDYLMLRRPGFIRDAVALYWWVKAHGLQAPSSDGRITKTYKAPDADEIPREYWDRVTISDDDEAAIAELAHLAANHRGDVLSELTALWKFARRRGASCDRLHSPNGETLQLREFPALESAVHAAIRSTLAEMERSEG